MFGCCNQYSEDNENKTECLLLQLVSYIIFKLLFLLCILFNHFHVSVEVAQLSDEASVCILAVFVACLETIENMINLQLLIYVVNRYRFLVLHVCKFPLLLIIMSLSCLILHCTVQSVLLWFTGLIDSLFISWWIMDTAKQNKHR